MSGVRQGRTKAQSMGWSAADDYRAATATTFSPNVHERPNSL